MVCSYGSGDELSNLHPINSQAINKLQSQVYIWNSNPGLRTSSLMYQLSISRYRKNPEIPDIAMWYFREKTVGNKMMKFMRKYENSTEDVLVSLKGALSTLVILYTARIWSFDLLTVVTVTVTIMISRTVRLSIIYEEKTYDPNCFLSRCSQGVQSVYFKNRHCCNWFLIKVLSWSF